MDGGSPGLVVAAEDSYLTGQGFRSQLSLTKFWHRVNGQKQIGKKASSVIQINKGTLILANSALGGRQIKGHSTRLVTLNH